MRSLKKFYFLQPPVLQVLPTMSDSWDCESWDTWELSDIVGSTCNTLGQRGTQSLVPRSMGGHSPWGHCPLSQGAKLHRLTRPLGSRPYPFIDRRWKSCNNNQQTSSECDRVINKCTAAITSQYYSLWPNIYLIYMNIFNNILE